MGNHRTDIKRSYLIRVFCRLSIAHSTISLKSTPTNQSKTATMVQNKGVIFKQIPQGLPVPGKDLAVEAREFDIDQAPPKGGVTTKNFYASFEAFIAFFAFIAFGAAFAAFIALAIAMRVVGGGRALGEGTLKPELEPH